MHNYNIFQTHIFSFECGLNLKRLVQHVNKQTQEDQGRMLSNQGGWQSNEIQDEEFYQPYLETLETKLQEVKKPLSLKDDIKIKIANAWVNVNNHKDSNQIHWHPNSFLSGSFYIYTPRDCGQIEFFHSAIDLIDGCIFPYEISEAQTNLFLSKTLKFPIKENMLYIFPSWLKHKVNPNMSNESRISLAFNTILENETNN